MNCHDSNCKTDYIVFWHFVECDSDVVQHGGNVGEEACGPERHPGEWGGLPERAGDPANGIIIIININI